MSVHPWHLPTVRWSVVATTFWRRPPEEPVEVWALWFCCANMPWLALGCSHRCSGLSWCFYFKAFQGVPWWSWVFQDVPAERFGFCLVKSQMINMLSVEQRRVVEMGWDAINIRLSYCRHPSSLPEPPFPPTPSSNHPPSHPTRHFIHPRHHPQHCKDQTFSLPCMAALWMEADQWLDLYSLARDIFEQIIVRLLFSISLCSLELAA